ncbi:superoxide dismutase family protein [Lachnospiraceae bacterium JLR.KK009]
MRNFYIETQNVNEICDEYENPGRIYLETALTQMPAAYAELTGNPGTGEISGMVRFYPVGAGILVNAEVYGLPVNPNPCGFDIFGFHIHEGHSCTGTGSDPYANAGAHFNPTLCPHPAHGGDLPPLFGNNGMAWMMYATDRFSIPEIIGKTVIIHSGPDDFSTQPAGNAGAKIACGTILEV